MGPKRVLGLAVVASALASSAALAATGTPERMQGTIPVSTADLVTVDNHADKPLAIAMTGTGAQVTREARSPNESPARVANIWGGFDHQPTENQVENAERVYRVAPNAQEQKREAKIVRQVYQDLLKSVDAGNIGSARG